MRATSNNWFVITGGPSTGKTTLIKELENLGHAIVPEAARTIIDQARLKGLSAEEARQDEKLFQHDVMKLKIVNEKLQPKSPITFLDRGMHDTLAYLRHHDYTIESWIEQSCRTASYRKVFLLEPLASFEQDYARIENDLFHTRIYALLKEAYEEAKIEVVSLPPFPVSERVSRILTEVRNTVLT